MAHGPIGSVGNADAINADAINAGACIPKNVPHLPMHMLERSEIVEALKRRVLGKPTATKGTKDSTVTAVQGMGGTGKTVCAAMLARDVDVGGAFERICWVSLGQEPSILQLQQVLHLQISNSPLPEHASNDVELASGALAKAAAGKKCLLVIDDIWSKEHAAPLTFTDAAQCGSVVVLTTRISSLIPGSVTFPVDLLSQDAAIQLLMQCGGVAEALKPGKDPPAAAIQAAEMCGIDSGKIAMLAAHACTARHAHSDRVHTQLWTTSLGIEHCGCNHPRYDRLVGG